MVFRQAVILSAVVSGFLTTALLPSQLLAVEPAEKFLQALRDRGYSDMALEYLNRMKDSDMVSPEFRVVIPYERGKTLFVEARRNPDPGQKEKLLNDAQVALKAFVTNNQTHPLASAASNELGNLIVERARMKVDLSKKPNYATQAATLRKEGLELFKEAEGLFIKTKDEIRNKLEQIPKVLGPGQQNLKDLQAQLRVDYLQSMLLTAAIQEEMAETAEKGSKEQKDLLTKAAEEYKEIYEKYRRRIAGLYARMYQGRCYQKMDDDKEAISFFKELVEDQPDDPQPFRDLKTKTYVMAVPSWAALGQYEPMIASAGKWINEARPNEEEQADFIELKFEFAKACVAYSEKLASGENPDKNKVREVEGLAVTPLRDVMKVPSPYKRQAQELLAKLDRFDLDKARPEPKNFVDARTAGKEALDAMQTAGIVVKGLPPRIAKEKDEKIKAELQKQYDEAVVSQTTKREEAQRYFRMALGLADEEIAIRDLNVVRYLLCYLYYAEEKYYEAALIGEFLLDRYPGGVGSKQSAKIALASYVRMYAAKKETEKSDTTFEEARIVAVGEGIADSFSGEPEAIEALKTVIPFKINAGKLDEAVALLDKVPENSASRADLELKTGQAMWGHFLNGSAEMRKWETEKSVPADVDVADRKAQLAEMKTQAESLLAAGMDRAAKSGTVTEVVVTANLSLAQLYVDTAKATEAVKLLELPKIGALTLCKSDSPVTQRPGFASETYKTALRAYIAQLAAGDDSANAVKKAESMMDALKTTTDDPKQLVSVYFSLATELERMISLEEDRGRKAQLSKGFETFLNKVGAESDEFNILNWVAESFYSMGEGFDAGATLSAEAKKYYEAAAKNFADILAKSKDFKLEPAMQNRIRMRLAMTKRRLGDYKTAVDMFAEMLKTKESLLNIQIEAATTLQDWGVAEDAEHILEAMRGTVMDSRTKKNVIWGWSRLMKVTSQDERFRDTMFEASYNLCLARYQYAMKQEGETKKKWLSNGEKAIEYFARSYPNLGGESTFQEFDTLYRRIQKELGSPGEPGIKAMMKRKEAETASTDT
jgi:tetratricopeptide (TPR) repeat protein